MIKFGCLSTMFAPYLSEKKIKGEYMEQPGLVATENSAIMGSYYHGIGVLNYYCNHGDKHNLLDNRFVYSALNRHTC